jgi:hypothetical protein
MKLAIALISCSALTLAACGPTGGGNNGGGGGGGNAPPLATNCALSPNQSSQQLSVDCTISGRLPNALIDPFDSGNTDCTPLNVANPGRNDPRDARLATLSSQSLSIPVTLLYGAQGDDNSERVRIDINLGTSTHMAQLGKTPTDCSVPTVNVPVTTTFSGMHTALIDKTQTPMCVFESRYTPASFSQTIGSGGPDAAIATRQSTEAAIARQLDLQAARTVNGLLAPNADLTGGFVTRSGRCNGDYAPFDG